VGGTPARAHRRALLERDLPGALASGALTVALQAIVPIGGGAPIGVEALARWNHPEVGAVPPLEFLQIADDLDLGGLVSARIASLAVQWAVEARAARLVDPGFAVHVHASARQITDPRFLAAVVDAARTLEGWARLFVEITETALMERPEEIGATLRALAVDGVGIALDDFGTGWSSLVHLRVLPVGCLKIDGSFISAVTTDPKAAEIVRSLAALARALDITVVAEGVESGAVARAAADLGCGAAQGYLYGRALGGARAMSAFDDLRRARMPEAPPSGSADPG
jgi:EAL domain-containing protein (putative c-di-GMP-specific phosphodiesterase class I)